MESMEILTARECCRTCCHKSSTEKCGNMSSKTRDVSTAMLWRETRHLHTDKHFCDEHVKPTIRQVYN
jgi:hypothetical protein